MEVPAFADLEAEFLARVGRMVWCNVATVDTRGRPRSRILHPVWEGPVGWIGTRPATLKAAHLARNPYVSLAYIADIAHPVYVDCRAEWIADLGAKQHFWDLVLATPPPLGYDPAPIYARVGHPTFGLLRLTPWRVALGNIPGEPQVWHAAALGQAG